jgi:ATP-binding cassette subfamily B protein
VTRNATVLIVAQRVFTILDADQILVLDEGEIVGRGTHASLLADNATYQEIVRSQLSSGQAA